MVVKNWNTCDLEIQKQYLHTEEQEEDILYLVVVQEEEMLYLVVVAMLIRSRLYETLSSPLLNALSSLVPARNCSRKQTLSLNVDKVHITYLGLFIYKGKKLVASLLRL